MTDAHEAPTPALSWVGANTARGNSEVAVIPEILDLATGESRIRLTCPDTDDILVPASYLPSLSSAASNASSMILSQLDKMRREFLDITSYGLKASPGAAGYIRNDADIAEGIPVIKWKGGNKEAAGNPRWALYLDGAADVEIASAPWSDPAALANVVSMMENPEALFAVGSLLDTGAISSLSARLAARALRSARRLPGIDLKKVRTILDAAGVKTPEDITPWNKARMRMLNLTSDDRQVPVAVGIQAYAVDSWTQLTEEERESVPRNDWRAREAMNKVGAQRADAIRIEWIAQARSALLAAGWREVSLPTPQRYGRPQGDQPSPTFLWVTRFTPDTWATVEAAAKAAARDVSMSRGAVI